MVRGWRELHAPDSLWGAHVSGHSSAPSTMTVFGEIFLNRRAERERKLTDRWVTIARKPTRQWYRERGATQQVKSGLQIGSV
jgi:hypothetical protein